MIVPVLWKYITLLVAGVCVCVSGRALAHHASWHAVGVTHERYGLPVVPLRIVEKRIVIPREGCAERDDCDLKEVVFFEEDDELPPDPRLPGDFLARSTAFLAGIETTSVAALERYVFVQFIRGCMWSSVKHPDGSMTTRFNVVREHLGRRTHFVHREWTVDSMDREPVYSAEGESGSRHFYLQWLPSRPAWVPDRQGKLFGEETPTVPFGFVTDFPTPLATFRSLDPNTKIGPNISGVAVNRSLELRMCLYRSADVPRTTDGGTRGFGTPIVCHTWRSAHVFDHERGVFTSPEGIHGECARPLNTEEEGIEDYFRRMREPNQPDNTTTQ